ncbi:cytochrome b5 [Butyriboletus roseoflavus]|nr:cytochrome b5 [Butyriboletus roseoflavus]
MPSYSIYVALALLLFFFRRRVRPRPPHRPALTTQTDSLKTIMQPPRNDLDPPKNDPFTLTALAQYDGSDDTKPIYVSIKGDVFDVTRKRDVYGVGGSYNIFAGKDGSRGLGKSSLKLEDAVPDYSTLPENEIKVLDDWYSFFSKRYNIVGRVTDMPEAVARRIP